MELLLCIIVFALGTIIGSFLNVVILRIGTGKGIMGRSFCMSCGKEIKSYDLIPILSFLFLGGKSRCCRSKISAQYPIVEFIAGAAFVSVFLKFYNLPSINVLDITFWYFAFSILIAIAVYDYKHQIIPDSLSYTFSFIAFLYFIYTINISTIFSYPQILNLLAGPIIFFGFSSLWIMSNGKWIGFGDGKLALGMGFALGIARSFSAVAFAFWLGAIYGIIVLLIQKIGIMEKKYKMNSAISFAPFMILGFYIAFMFNADIFNFNTLIFQGII